MRTQVRATVVVAGSLVLGFASGGPPGLLGQSRLTEVPSGPAPSVGAIEIESGMASFGPSADAPLPPPNHPPIHLIPPKPMPDDSVEPLAAGPGAGVLYDAVTRAEREWPADFSAATGGPAFGGGYGGADGGGGQGDVDRPASFGTLGLISTASRAIHPWRMNVKLVMRFGTQYFVCSGTMRDAETVLTAGHCVHDGPGGTWADEIWVYPGWDGVGTVNPAPPAIANPYGWAHGTFFGSWTGWTNNGDFNYDVGLIGVTRAVGMLTGWFGWAWGGGACPFFPPSETYHNASYPAESCGSPGLHNGRDMYYWFGTWDSCSGSNRLQIDTGGGCFDAGWGGMSGSGAYRIEGDNRYVHAMASTSDRDTYVRYSRQFEDWVNWSNGTFIPQVRGSSFDLQALDVNASPLTIPAGTSTSVLNHLATNPTDGAANATWTFRVYLSTNTDISSADTLLSTQSYAWTFGAMNSVTVNMAQVTIPSNTPPGSYYLGVIYDSATDGNSANNDTDGWDAVAITVTKPDLDIIAFSAPASAEPGDSITVSNTVQNIGNAAAGSFRLGLYLSTDSVCTTADTFLGSRAIAGLLAGGSSAQNTVVQVPPGTTLGARFVCGIADDLSQIPESNEGNNTASDSIAIVRPDLRITVASAPANASPGAGISVSNTVFNGGTGAAGPFRVGVYLSADAACTVGDTFLGSRNVAGLGAGSSSAANTPVTIPPGTPLGNRNVCVIADDLAQVTESNEANNSLSDPIAILSPTPIITLKVNGQHPTPPVVSTSGPIALTIDVSPTTYTATLDWYWALILNGQVYWVTAGGLSTTPAPLVSQPPTPLADMPLFNLTLPPGTSMTNAFFMVNGSTVVSSDFITANVVTPVTP